MPLRLPVRSLGLRLVVVMVVPVIILVIPAYFAFSRLEVGVQRSGAVSNDQQEARTIARVEATRQSSPDELRAFQGFLGDDQLVVVRGGRVAFRGPPNDGATPFRVSARFPGGTVRIIGDVEQPVGRTLELTAIAGGALLLVALAALAGTAFTLRSIRGPVARAAEVAERVGTGDLTAKVRGDAPEEFARLARALDTMTARLDEADQAQRRFLADLAHEIATPVSSIASLAAAVMDGTLSSEESRAEASRLLAGETTRLHGLLDDLAHLRNLDLAESVAFQRVDLAALVRQQVARFAPEARGTGVELSETVGDGRLELDTDPRLVETVVGNLVSNAIRYTPAGGQVRVALRPGADDVAVAVRDSGVGIPPDEAHRVFDRFYRVDKSRSRGGGGTGLGLSIAQRAALALGGRVEFDSQPGAGSEFRLVLPVTTPAVTGP